MALRSLRGNIAKFVTKIFLVVLAISFLFWGINASVLEDNDEQTVAHIGDFDISAQEYAERLTKISEQFAQNVGMKQLDITMLKRFGLDRVILNNLINEKLLDNFIATHNIDISNEYITEQIKKDPSFQRNNKFSKGVFAQILRSNNFTEDDYRLMLRDAYLRQQIVLSLFTPVNISPVFNDIYAEFLYNTLNVDYITISKSDLSNNSKPITENDIVQYYKDNKQDFFKPAYRSVRYVKIDENDVTQKISVSEEEISDYYTTHLQEFNKPEERIFEVLTLPDSKEAQSVYEELLAGKDFYEIAQKKGFSKQDLLVERSTKQDISDEAIADMAFMVSKNTFSEPVETLFGFSIVRVKSIFPSKNTSFEDAKETITTNILNETKYDLLQDRINEFEQARTQSSQLSLVAKGLGYTYKDTPFIDINGIQENGESSADPYITRNLLEEIYESDIGVENASVDLDNGGALWFEVLTIKEASFSTLEESKKDIIASLKEQQIEQELIKFSKKILKDANTNGSLFDATGKINKQVTTYTHISRQSYNTKLPSEAVNEIFNYRQGERGYYYDKNAQIVYLFEIIKRNRFLEKHKDEVSSKVKQDFNNTPIEDFHTAFLEYLRSQYKVNINKDAIDNVLQFMNQN